MEIKVTSEAGDSRTWGLPKALLTHHSGYFKRACRSDIFVEGQDNKVEIRDFEPDTFDMFVEFMYYGRYMHKDDLENYFCVRPSAKAWVLGDYLDAVEFKDFAMHYLHEIYMPTADDDEIDDNSPLTGIGPGMIGYCCSKTAPQSRLYRLVKAFLVQNWHDNQFIQYDYTNREEWDSVWAQHPELVSDLLFHTQQEKFGRVEHEPELEHYLEALDINDEPAGPAGPTAPTAPTASAAPAGPAAPTTSATPTGPADLTASAAAS